MLRSIHLQRILHLVVTMGLLILLTNSATVSAQPTQALVEDWRSTDFNFISSMMDTDSSDNVYVLVDTAATNILNIKKFSAAGALLWQTTYDPVDALRGVWIAVDGNGGDRVIDGGRGPIGAAHFQAARPQAGEGLRRGDFVDKVQIDVQHRGRAGLLRDDVRVPDFVKEGLRSSHDALSVGLFRLTIVLQRLARAVDVAVLGQIPLGHGVGFGKGIVPLGHGVDVGVGLRGHGVLLVMLNVLK